MQTSKFIDTSQHFHQFLIKFSIVRIVEVFSWLLEVANDTKEHWDGARIVWTVSYVHDGPKTKDISAEALHPHEEHRKKLVAKLEIQKDDIQSVLPISKVGFVLDDAAAAQ